MLKQNSTRVKIEILFSLYFIIKFQVDQLQQNFITYKKSKQSYTVCR